MFTNLHVNKQRDTVVFETNGISPSIINGLRRIIITDIPVAGFSGEENPSMEVLRNNGPLHNEFLLHRMGLIPIHFSEEDVEAFDANEYVFEVHVENAKTAMVNVTSKDIRVTKNGAEVSEHERERLFPANSITHEHVLITRLRKGEYIHMKGRAIIDTARSHSGFSPGFCTFFAMEDPVLAAKATNILDKERAYSRNEWGDPAQYKMTIETECGLTPKYLVLKAFEIMKGKLHTTLQELYQDESEKVKVTEWVNENGLSGYEFTFKDEDDTLGYLLQWHMFQHYIREHKKTEHGKDISYVGYFCPHPLESVMVLRMIFAEPAPMLEYIEAFAEQCRRITTIVQALEADWIRFQNE